MPSFIASTLLLAAAVVQGVAAQNCSISFEGRVKQDFELADFDSNVTSVWNPSFVLGRNTKWSQILAFPRKRTNTLFSTSPEFKSIEMTINDGSLFQPNPADNTSVQTGFRRSELIPVVFPVSGADSSSGVKTFHFSLKANPARPLNFSHEYSLVFQEDSSYSTNQFVLKTGTIIGTNGTAGGKPMLLLQGNQNTAETLFAVPFDQRVWHNYGILQDFNANTIRVYYSTGTAPLKARTDAIPNDNSGGGEFHFGMLKKPTGTETDVTKSGFQSSGIDERLSYAGIFQENSEGGCISLGGEVPRSY
ncbi:hypothetical protein CAC42_5359 [Sphaceloma murrayae]|uniref:Glycoside hydrolase 131 catalytic N-terminal domain-containing protein n=1 Tax=Sphaceloma murrayae TaxID=2082308 RepID=A0A2K1QV38_9PEZI|nr:hypothetical protein CAC42_5359 [Sphaceloma murrayae]